MLVFMLILLAHSLVLSLMQVLPRGLRRRKGKRQHKATWDQQLEIFSLHDKNDQKVTPAPGATDQDAVLSMARSVDSSPILRSRSSTRMLDKRPQKGSPDQTFSCTSCERTKTSAFRRSFRDRANGLEHEWPSNERKLPRRPTKCRTRV